MKGRQAIPVCVCWLFIFEGHRAEPLTGLLQRAPTGRLTLSRSRSHSHCEIWGYVSSRMARVVILGPRSEHRDQHVLLVEILDADDPQAHYLVTRRLLVVVLGKEVRHAHVRHTTALVPPRVRACWGPSCGSLETVCILVSCVLRVHACTCTPSRVHLHMRRHRRRHSRRVFWWLERIAGGRRRYAHPVRA